MVLVPVTISYSLGYRLDSGFRLKTTGGLFVASPVSGSEIFINSDLHKRTNLLQSGIFVQNLSPGKYKLLVVREGYIPWAKELEVASRRVTEGRALLVPYNTNGAVLLKGRFSALKSSPFDPVLLLVEEGARANILNWYLPSSGEFLSPPAGRGDLSFKKSFELVRWRENGVTLKLDGQVLKINFDLNQRTLTLAGLAGEASDRSPEEELASVKRAEARGNIELFWDEDRKELKARWLKDEIPPYYFRASEELLLADKNVRNFEFFPKRRDAALVSFDNGVWALELDGRGGRNIEPVYKGKSPDFALLPGEDNLYILDDGNVIRASLKAGESF